MPSNKVSKLQTARSRAASSSLNEDQIILGLLDAIERDSTVTQRSISSELGIALGLANAYLKRCVRKGLVKVSQIPARRYAYFLTPQGFVEKSRLTASYLSHSFAFFRNARTQCGAIFDVAVGRGQTRLVLLGAGDLAEIATLVAGEKGVQIVGIWSVNDIVKSGHDAQALAEIDAVVVTELQESRSASLLAIKVFGKNRVHVPGLLRVRYSGFDKDAVS